MAVSLRVLSGCIHNLFIILSGFITGNANHAKKRAYNKIPFENTVFMGRVRYIK
jgi:hypothetical protein